MNKHRVQWLAGICYQNWNVTYDIFMSTRPSTPMDELKKETAELFQTYVRESIDCMKMLEWDEQIYFCQCSVMDNEYLMPYMSPEQITALRIIS